VATLSEKVDDTSKKNAESQNEDEKVKEAHPLNPIDDGKNAKTSDKRENSNQEDASYGDEVGEQRFLDHTLYRHKIGEDFSERQPSDLAPSNPACFNIDDQVARSLADLKFAAKRHKYSTTAANASFASTSHEAQKYALEAFEAGTYKAARRLFKQACKKPRSSKRRAGV